MKTYKRKSIIDDGMNPELVFVAKFDGYFSFPIISKPEEFVIPTNMVPFSKRNRNVDPNTAICFYEMDRCFSEMLISPKNYVDEFKQHILISPDCSLYRDAPLAVQIANIYRSRAIGYFYQSHGVYVIPNVRWGNALTYTTELLPERIAFKGIEKHSIVSISNYGCFRTRGDKYYFEAGLAAMLEELEPKIVLLYGSWNEKIFCSYKKYTKFEVYKNWVSQKRGMAD